MAKHYADRHAAPSKYGLVFPTANGRWQSTNNWRRRGFQAACLEAGLVERVESRNGTIEEVPKYKPYDLRHFYASMLIEQNVNVKRIQKLMGHSDIQTTLNVYGHVLERAETERPRNSGVLASIVN